MAIEVKCEKCGQSLRANLSHVGKKARCPKCGAAVLITAGDATTEQSDPANQQKSAEAAAGWFVQADGDEFGPISKTELDEWAAEGRLDVDCKVRCENWPATGWKSAASLYPDLEEAQAETTTDDSVAVTKQSSEADDEFELAPLDDESTNTTSGSPKQADTEKATGETAVDSDNPFANLEAATDGNEMALGDLSELAALDFGGSPTTRVAGDTLQQQPALADDEIQAAQPGALEEALAEPATTAKARLGASTSSGGSGALDHLADIADQMQASVQAVAFLTLAGCGLAGIIGIFWVARSAPSALWAFTVSGFSLIVVAACAGLAAKNLLTYFSRIDAFADKANSQELTRQMTAARAFWKSALIAVIITLTLALISLLAFVFIPVEHKGKPSPKQEQAWATSTMTCESSLTI